MDGNGGDERRHDAGGGLELIDEPRGVGEREFLGAGDAEVAEQAVEVGVLAAGDRDDRPDLAGRGGLADLGRVGREPRGGLPLLAWTPLWWPLLVEGCSGLARLALGLEPGQFVVHGLLGGEERIADLVAEAGRVVEQARSRARPPGCSWRRSTSRPAGRASSRRRR